MYTESGNPDGTGRGGAWNPLNTTWKLTAATAPSGKASTDFNFIAPGVAVQNYATFEDGLHATRLTLLQNCCGFPKIVKRFRSNWWTAYAIMRAIDGSDWGTSGLIVAVYGDIKNGAYWSRAITQVAGS